MQDSSLNRLLAYADLNIVEFDIHSRTAMNTKNRVRPYYIMSYHKRGSAKLRIGDSVHAIDPGTVVLIPPNVEHDHYKDTPEESVFLWWHFTFDIAGVLDVFKLFDLPVTFKLENTDQFEQAFIQYKECATMQQFLPTKILEKAKALELLYLLLVGAVSLQRSSLMEMQADSFVEILAQMVQHPERSVSLRSLSQKLQMHPTYVSNRFKELFGKSPIQVHREMKIDMAKMLLRTSELPINQVAERIGFSGIPSFSRLFKSYVGISPSQYRQINKSGA